MLLSRNDLPHHEMAPGNLIRESIRLAALDSYGILDTRPEAEFDAFVREAASRFGTPISLISLIDDRRQWFKAKVGLAAMQTDRKIAFCAHAVASSTPLIVHDTLRDSRFVDNPMVTGAPRIRFYAGAPLITPLARCLGTINVIDVVPRPSWSDEDTADLVAIAHNVMKLLERRRSDIVRQRALAGRAA